MPCYAKEKDDRIKLIGKLGCSAAHCRQVAKRHSDDCLCQARLSLMYKGAGGGCGVV